MRLQSLQISKARLRNPLLSAYPQGKEGEALKGPFLNFYHYKLCWFTGPWHSKRCSGPCQASALIQSYHQHQAGKSCSFYTDWPLTGNRQLIHQKLYIIGNYLGQNKTGWCGGGVEETLPPYSQNTEQCLLWVTQGFHSPNCTRSPLG